jgi:hypothetical protein
MSLPNSIVRRYTPPTCTLEVAAKESPLSRWVGQPVLKHLRFHLSFDDPRISADQWIRVQGDRPQLEALYETVTTYVQDFLQSTQSLNHPLTELPLTDPLDAIGGAPRPAAVHQSDSAARGLYAAANSGVEQLPNSPGFFLRPKGLLSHELALGPLATEAVGATIHLSAVQLADLATALDEYRADVTALPNLNRPRWIQPAPVWARIAAVSLIVVGVSTSIVRLFEPASNSSTRPTSSQGASSADQRLAVQPLGSPTPSASPAFPPLVTVPTPPVKSKGVPPKPVPPPTSAPIKLPTVAVPQKAPTNPDPDQRALKIEAPLPAAPPEVASVPSAIGASEPAPARDASPPPAAAARRGTFSGNSTAKESATVFDTTPQVAEVRTYFQANWKPPEGLAENLEYSLILTPNGAIQEVIPLTKISEEFRDRVTVPAPGAPFLTPSKSNGNLRIRLLLNPDGKVQTFSESANGQ